MNNYPLLLAYAIIMDNSNIHLKRKLNGKNTKNSFYYRHRISSRIVTLKELNNFKVFSSNWGDSRC